MIKLLFYFDMSITMRKSFSYFHFKFYSENKSWSYFSLKILRQILITNNNNFIFLFVNILGKKFWNIFYLYFLVTALRVPRAVSWLTVDRPLHISIGEPNSRRPTHTPKHSKQHQWTSASFILKPFSCKRQLSGK